MNVANSSGRVWIGFVAFALLSAVGRGSSAEPTPSKEYQIKAAFLYNFAQFVEWPPGSFSEARSPLVIGVLGDDPFGGFLDELVREEKVNGRDLIVQRYRRQEEINACHILFISQSEMERLKDILAALKGRSILTVGDGDQFATRGGMIRFVTEKNKIQLRINGEAVKAAKLTISSKLLRLAEMVRTGKD